MNANLKLCLFLALALSSGLPVCSAATNNAASLKCIAKNLDSPDRQLPSPPAYPANGKISPTAIRTILDSMDRGMTNKDAAVAVAHFASNAVITAVITEGTRTVTNRDDTAGYRLRLENGFSAFSDYQFTRRNVATQIDSDGRTATSSYELIETFRFDGKPKQAVTRESATFAVIEGKVLLTAMNSEVTIK
jgi:hypothetical protein